MLVVFNYEEVTRQGYVGGFQKLENAEKQSSPSLPGNAACWALSFNPLSLTLAFWLLSCKQSTCVVLSFMVNMMSYSSNRELMQPFVMCFKCGFSRVRPCHMSGTKCIYQVSWGNLKTWLDIPNLWQTRSWRTQDPLCAWDNHRLWGRAEREKAMSILSWTRHKIIFTSFSHWARKKVEAGHFSSSR